MTCAFMRRPSDTKPPRIPIGFGLANRDADWLNPASGLVPLGLGLPEFDIDGLELWRDVVTELEEIMESRVEGVVTSGRVSKRLVISQASVQRVASAGSTRAPTSVNIAI